MASKRLARPVLRAAARVPPVRRALIAWYDGRDSGNGWSRPHPFDLREGTRTSGSVPGFLIRGGDSFDRPTTNYGACQPSVASYALAQVPDPERFAFVDLGCGKGRVMAVASEFPFRAVVGIELSPALARIARRNAALIADRHPERPRLVVQDGDATRVPLPRGPLVLFMYNPFGADVVSAVAARARALPELYVVYVNPVHGHVLDRSPALRRHHAATVTYAPEEIGFGPGSDDAVVIWRRRDGCAAPAAAEWPIVVSEPGWRAELSGAERVRWATSR